MENVTTIWLQIYSGGMSTNENRSIFDEYIWNKNGNGDFFGSQRIVITSAKIMMFAINHNDVEC